MVRKEIGVLLVAAVLSYFAEALYSPFYALYVEDVGGGVAEAGLAWGIYMVVVGLASLLSARLVHRLKKHAWLLYTGFLLASLLSLSYLFIDNVYQLYLIQFLMGLVWAVVNPVWDAYYSLFVTRDRATLEWSLFEGGSRLATGLGALLGGLVISYFGFPSVFILAALLNFLAALLLFLERRALSVVY